MVERDRKSPHRSRTSVRRRYFSTFSFRESSDHAIAQRTHFIIKVFAFRFVCYFAALYYYSFIGVGDSDPHGTEQGIVRVASTLFTYITIAHWWNIFLQVFFPLLLHRWRTYRERLQLKEELRTLEMAELKLSAPDHEKTSEERAELKKQLLNKRLLLEHAQINLWEEVMLPEHDSFVDYLFAVTQFAYVTCFSVILPITPLVVLINHLLNMRLDAFKLCRGRRRPLVQKTGGIGVWNHVLHIVTVIAILTNCSLMALTSSQFSGLAQEIGYLGVFALAICWEHFMLLVKYILQLTVSIMPKQVQDAMNKKQYDQERKRYKTLRDKKRRSGSTDAAESGPRPNSSSSDERENLQESARVISQASPCPVIRESPTESHSQSSGSDFSSRPSTTSDSQTAALIEQGHPTRLINSTNSTSKSAVNVHATKCHSPLHPRPLRPGLQRNYAKSSNTTPPKHNNENENVHPNLDESSPKGRLQQYSSKRAQPRPLSNADRPRHPSNSTRHECDRPDDVGECRLFGEQITSPDSSISTVPGFPTPCHLNLDESSDTIMTSGNEGLSEDIDDQSFSTSGSGYYQHATAPPLSPGSDQYGMRKSSASRPGSSTNEDSDGEFQSKWGMHLGHFAQYARSERSLHLSEKKSR